MADNNTQPGSIGSLQQSGVAVRPSKLPAYMTIQGYPGSTTVLLGGPVIKASIQRNTDISLHKTGRNSFVLQSFGHFPVAITITGITLLHDITPCLSDSLGGSGSIRLFYSNYNIGNAANVNKRVHIVVDKTVYECCVVGLSLEAQQGAVTVLCTLSLIGAAR